MIGQNGFDITTKAVINGSAFDLYEAQEVEGSFQIDSTVALDRPVSPRKERMGYPGQSGAEIEKFFAQKWRPMRDDNSQASPTDPTRRNFLVNTGSAAAVTVLSAYLPVHAAETAQSGSTEGSHNEGAVPITFRINGKERQLRIDPRTTLLDCLRETVALTGTKKGCDHGQCGACTVHVNGRRVLSCLTLALLLDGQEITTIEGLGTPDALHPMQAAFLAIDGYQCGYCTSGQIMSAVALLKEPCGPDDASVKELMSGNICRCGAYSNIVAAIQQVRKNT